MIPPRPLGLYPAVSEHAVPIMDVYEATQLTLKDGKGFVSAYRKHDKERKGYLTEDEYVALVGARPGGAMAKYA